MCSIIPYSPSTYLLILKMYPLGRIKTCTLTTEIIIHCNADNFKGLEKVTNASKPI